MEVNPHSDVPTDQEMINEAPEPMNMDQALPDNGDGGQTVQTDSVDRVQPGDETDGADEQSGEDQPTQSEDNNNEETRLSSETVATAQAEVKLAADNRAEQAAPTNQLEVGDLVDEEPLVGCENQGVEQSHEEVEVAQTTEELNESEHVPSSSGQALSEVIATETPLNNCDKQEDSHSQAEVEVVGTMEVSNGSERAPPSYDQALPGMTATEAPEQSAAAERLLHSNDEESADSHPPATEANNTANGMHSAPSGEGSNKSDVLSTEDTEQQSSPASDNSGTHGSGAVEPVSPGSLREAGPNQPNELLNKPDELKAGDEVLGENATESSRDSSDVTQPENQAFEAVTDGPVDAKEGGKPPEIPSEVSPSNDRSSISELPNTEERHSDQEDSQNEVHSEGQPTRTFTVPSSPEGESVGSLSPKRKLKKRLEDADAEPSTAPAQRADGDDVEMDDLDGVQDIEMSRTGSSINDEHFTRKMRRRHERRNERVTKSRMRGRQNQTVCAMIE
ncbi:hypothetical protein KEM56_001732 [Ascosphaera pollenicola]|nr:hypothetical protein KEM56_001732 [Ascosphaera pollenicola]